MLEWAANARALGWCRRLHRFDLQALIRRRRAPLASIGVAILSFAAVAAAAQSTAAPTAPGWGAIATAQQWYGYAFDEASAAAAERSARLRCQSVAVRGQACNVRVVFQRECAALAFGNYGEWGAAKAPTREQAAQAAAQQCNQHLPTEPCKVALRVCSAVP